MKILAVGASAGGVEALERVVADLPADLDACVLVTVHTSPTARSSLPQILSRVGRLPAAHAHDGTPLRPNTILVAPPDRHLLMLDGQARLNGGPKVNRHRPSVDVLFASAARWAGRGAVAVVLSGALDDGAVGATLIARTGGQVFVQDPAEARFAGMPRAALAAVPTATAASARELGAMLAAAMRTRAARPGSRVDQEGALVSMADSADPRFLLPDETSLTRLACPECHGVLAQVELPTISYFRCHVGHQWSPQSLAAAQAQASEAALWTAAAALEEQAALRRYLAGSAGNGTAEHLEAAQQAGELAQLIKDRLDSTAGEPPNDRETL